MFHKLSHKVSLLNIRLNNVTPVILGGQQTESLSRIHCEEVRLTSMRFCDDLLLSVLRCNWWLTMAYNNDIQ